MESEAIRYGSKQSPSRWDIETRTRDACATQRFAADTAAATTMRLALTFLVSEEAAAADDLGNLRRHHLVPAFVSSGDALEHVP